MIKLSSLVKTAAVVNRILDKSKRRKKEHELWNQWKGGDQQALGGLFQSLNPLIRRISLGYQGNLPPAFVEGEVKKHAFKAIQSWDPKKSQMNTHIMNRTQKTLREIYKYQNPTRLAEASHRQVPSFNNLFENMKQQKGRDPTVYEMAREFGVSVGEARRLRLGMRRDLSQVEGGLLWAPEDKDREKEILDQVYYELNPQEAQVYEHTFGLNKKKALGTKQTAAAMKLTPARVSQVKKDVAHKMQKYFGGQKLQTSTFY